MYNKEITVTEAKFKMLCRELGTDVFAYREKGNIFQVKLMDPRFDKEFKEIINLKEVRNVKTTD